MIETIFMIFLKILAGIIALVLISTILKLAIDMFKSTIKRGHWIEEEYSKEDDCGIHNFHYYICSECYERISNQNFNTSWVYCPHCGTYMKERRNK